ncbi:MAG: hypothetical protein LH606_12605 [Cytophagaceae bacterium]|nr:hypothetical protein [Cytophagaceae bacterium]
MPVTRQPVKIFIASSGDLVHERDRCELLLGRIGKEHDHLHLEPMRWEKDLESGSVPTNRIQDAITPFLDESNFVFLLCYSRIGPYTLEEYRRALAAGKKVFVYFKTEFSPATNREKKAFSKVIDTLPEDFRVKKQKD